MRNIKNFSLILLFTFALNCQAAELNSDKHNVLARSDNSRAHKSAGRKAKTNVDSIKDNAQGRKQERHSKREGKRSSQKGRDRKEHFQDKRQDRKDHFQDKRQDRKEHFQDKRQDRKEHFQDKRQDRKEHFQDKRQDRAGDLSRKNANHSNVNNSSDFKREANQNAPNAQERKLGKSSKKPVAKHRTKTNTKRSIKANQKKYNASSVQRKPANNQKKPYKSK